LIGKPRRRRVWEGETRGQWKRSKRSDLPKGAFNRHQSAKEAKRREKKKANRAARAAEAGE
jgi:hypothetical protein